MSVVTDYEDVNEWSLFGGQLLDVSSSSSSLVMVDSWQEAMPDSSETTMQCTIEMEDVGITSSLKVLSCSTDDGEFSDVVKDSDSASYSSIEDVTLDLSGAAQSSVSKVGAWQRLSICGTRLASLGHSPKTIGNTAVDLSNSRDVDLASETVLEYVDEAEVEELVCEYSDLIDVCCNLSSSHSFVSHNAESLSSYNDDNDSGSSTYDQESLGNWLSNGVGFSRKGVERRVRKKEQNKTAALRYRMKKRIERGSMQQEYDALIAKNIELKSKIQQMMREITYLSELITEIK